MSNDIPLHGDIVTELGADYVITIGGNVGDSSRRRCYPLTADGHLVVEQPQLYVQEEDNGVLPNLPVVDASANFRSDSTGRIFA